MNSTLFWILLCVVPATASAAKVYACKGKNGETIYTNLQCPDPATTKAIGSYDKVPDDPRTQRQAAGQSSKSAPVSDVIVESSDGGYGSQADSSRPSSVHQCSGGGKSWIQSAPCPSSVTTFTPIVGIHTSDGISSGTLVGQEQVQQTEMSHDEACQKIHQQQNTGSPKDAYERNKMRGNEGC